MRFANFHANNLFRISLIFLRLFASPTKFQPQRKIYSNFRNKAEQIHIDLFQLFLELSVCLSPELSKYWPKQTSREYKKPQRWVLTSCLPLLWQPWACFLGPRVGALLDVTLSHLNWITFALVLFISLLLTAHTSGLERIQQPVIKRIKHEVLDRMASSGRVQIRQRSS